MPELPELEALAQTLQSTLPSPPVEVVRLSSPSILKTFTPPIEDLVGQRLVDVTRRGKWLLFRTDVHATLGIHLMTGGRLRRTDGTSKPARTEALVVRFEGGADLRVAEIGSKKQSGAHFVMGDGSELVAHLGPEPLALDFSVEQLEKVLRGPQRQAKTALVDQRTLAGVGNAWGDEVLHAAGLSPLLLTSRLTSADVEALHAALRSRLQDGIDRARTDNYLEKLKSDKREYLLVHNRQGQPCPRCSKPLAAIYSGERATTYCPECQSGGRVYADRRLSRLLK